MAAPKSKGDNFIVVVPLDDGFDGSPDEIKPVPTVAAPKAVSILSAEGGDEGPVPQDQQYAANRMLLSHFLTRMGDKMWEFIIPLILITIAPDTLIPAALFGLVTTLVRVLFGTSIGHQIDFRSRIGVIRFGIGFQAISVGLSSIILQFLLNERSPELSENIFYSLRSTGLLIALLASAAIGSLAAQGMDISVERDWVPCAITHQAYLTQMNTRMRQIDLVTEVAGPLLAGFLILIPATDERTSFIIVAVFNFVTFLPQYFLLTMVYDNNEHLRAPKEQPPSNPDDLVHRSAFSEWWYGEWNPIMNLYNSWDLFMAQPINYLSISFALLWLTILSPHDVVFTAYLKSQGYTDWELGVFRGVGALFGVASTLAFPWFVEKYGLQWASFIYIFEEAAMVVAASVIFTLNYKAETQLLRFAFLGFILLSRCGLYGFEVGEIQMLQVGIPENIRGRVNSVESSLTSLASLAVFVAGLAFNNPRQFIYLCWGSAAFVSLGAFVYLKWNATWKLVSGPHRHAKGADSDHAHHARQNDADGDANSIEHDHRRFERR